VTRCHPPAVGGLAGAADDGAVEGSVEAVAVGAVAVLAEAAIDGDGDGLTGDEQAAIRRARATPDRSRGRAG